jgi:ATP-dependent RNA helicase DDX52/ROK1
LARGIDFRNVNLVINYDFPNSMLTYIHRVGRTGRADRTGTAITLFTDEDRPLVRSLANLLSASGCKLPDWIKEMPKAKKQLRKKLEKFPVKRLPVGRANGRDKEWTKELEVLEKRWQKLKKTETEKAVKREQKAQA